jgi:hypothetical protein
MYTLSIKSLVAVTYLYDEKQEVKNVGEVITGFVQEHVPNVPLLFQVQLGKLYRMVYSVFQKLNLYFLGAKVAP